MSSTRFPDSLGELLQFLGGSFHGGTDPGPALDAAMRRIERPEYARADLLVITDGVFALDRGLVARFKAARERMDFHLHALIIGEDPVQEALPMADVRWTWKPGAQFRDGGVQLVKAIERPRQPASVASSPPEKEASQRSRVVRRSRPGKRPT